MKLLFTIGHSTYDVNYFIRVLKKYNINCVVDVRSTPYSKYSSEYNKENIKRILKENNIVYIYMGIEFGARRASKQLYTADGYVDFEKVKEDSDFKSGVERIKNGLKKGYNIAFMCTEKKPEDCHRCILVGRNFSDLGYKVVNIINEDESKTQKEIEYELLDIYYPQRNQIALIPDMNLADKSDDELIKEVYMIRNKEIGYTGDE